MNPTMTYSWRNGLTSLHRAWRWHHSHATNYASDRPAVTAMAFARAEMEMAARGWRVQYAADWDGAPHEFCDACANGHCRADHKCLMLTLVDEEGKVLASIGGVWDASPDYLRTLAAELANDALWDMTR